MTIKNVFLFQAIYYSTTALWPILHIKSFEKITGPKTDKWLVQTVGSLLLFSSLVFLYSALRENAVPVETLILVITNCLALIIVDVFFVVRKTISKTYLLDALLEILLIGAFVRLI